MGELDMPFKAEKISGTQGTFLLPKVPFPQGAVKAASSWICLFAVLLLFFLFIQLHTTVGAIRMQNIDN